MKQLFRNIPIPEGHVVFLVLGFLIQWLMDGSTFKPGNKKKIAGSFLLINGVVLSGWAVKSAGNTDIESPDRIISTGAYAFCRNPMYSGWHLIYTGIALMLNSRWLFILFPLLAFFTHYLVILPEERMLEQQFGTSYYHYKQRVKRYFW
jgi:protein-S-isoprenylcysteine O-methyltransferase Ste14